jgi:hypothetical protein
MDHHAIALAVRWLHVAAMATLLGGAILVAWLAARQPRAVVDVALRYEQVFWAGIAFTAMTGVGNLGAFGLALPAPSTAWGAIFTWKMVAVAALVGVSLTRSLIVGRLERVAHEPATVLRWLYVSTAALLAAIAGIAVWLAHG